MMGERITGNAGRVLEASLGHAEAVGPHPLTQWFLSHPWQGAAASGALIAGWVLVLSHGVWFLSMAVGLLVFLFVGMVWREGGPGYRWRQWMLRNFPKDQPKGG